MKNPLTPAGIDPATFQFEAQHLNHCATAESNYEQNTVFVYEVILHYTTNYMTKL